VQLVLDTVEGGRPWRQGFVPLRDTVPMSPAMALIRRLVLSELDAAGVPHPELPGGRPPTLSSLGLWLASSAGGVDTVLCGARRPAYVQELLAVPRWEPLGDETVRRVLRRVRDSCGSAAASGA
jgi:hypothetical protein